MTTLFGPGVLARIGEVIAPSASVFLVTGQRSYTTSGAAQALSRLLTGRDVAAFRDFEANPKLVDAERGIAAFSRRRRDVIVAVGGGSVIDIAKLIAVCSRQPSTPEQIVTGAKPITRASCPIVAVPTTAGSGSEVTRFAVVYFDRRKYSVAHDSMLPDYAIVDPRLCENLPPFVTACSGLDALCQAVEAIWSVNSTEQSHQYATEACQLALRHLSTAVHSPDCESRQAMSRAALFAGKAINITKTTAPHALSYSLTSHFGVPHGHAVSLLLGPVLEFNGLVSGDDVADPRGIGHVRRMIDHIIGLLGCGTVAEARQVIHDLIGSIGLPTRLRDIGVKSQLDRDLIADNVNLERLDNNPRAITRHALHRIIDNASSR